jgi:hypothetical protein
MLQCTVNLAPVLSCRGNESIAVVMEYWRGDDFSHTLWQKSARKAQKIR